MWINITEIIVFASIIQREKRKSFALVWSEIGQTADYFSLALKTIVKFWCNYMYSLVQIIA